jgi:ABC-type transporter Mla MlaB component
MLRITTTEAQGRVKWVLQGQLAGPWVEELKLTWDKSEKHPTCLIDLTDVTFVDEAGARVLCAMKAAGAEFVAGGVDTKHLLDELTRKTAPPLRRCLSWLANDACRKDRQ